MVLHGHVILRVNWQRLMLNGINTMEINQVANRGDFERAKLPRYLKRMLSASSRLSGNDVHHDAQVRKIFIEAHAAHVAWHKKMLSSKFTDTSEEPV
jgi:hypothetical protein